MTALHAKTAVDNANSLNMLLGAFLSAPMQRTCSYCNFKKTLCYKLFQWLIPEGCDYHGHVHSYASLGL